MRYRGRRIQEIAQKGLFQERVEHFGEIAAHPGALAGGKDHDAIVLVFHVTPLHADTAETLPPLRKGDVEFQDLAIALFGDVYANMVQLHRHIFLHHTQNLPPQLWKKIVS
jgi:hypothetical protein